MKRADKIGRRVALDEVIVEDLGRVLKIVVGTTSVHG